MTVSEATTLLFDWFAENDSFEIEEDFKIIKDVFGFFNTGHLISIKPRKKGYKKFKQ